MALHTNPAGTAVTEVAVERDGERETFSADIVVVSCGAANSAKLLLASATDKHPNGLSNSSDQLGRNYTFHNSQAVLALSKEENPTVFQKTLGLNDFYFGSDDFEYPLGNIQMVGKSSGRHVPGREAARDQAGADAHAGEHGPPRRRLLALDRGPAATREPRDARPGRERPAQLHPDQPRVREAPLPRAQGAAGDTGMHPDHLIPRHAYLKTEIPVAGVAHQAGTCRFGTDPETSVLDTDCRAHELDNLYVVDTSFFPSIGAVNPALTAMANALRVGDHLLERLGAQRPAKEAAGAG